MKLILFLIYSVLFSFFLAQWEVQIEGKDGWAAKLPTWRKSFGFWPKLLGKPLTGYHLYLVIVFLILIHFPIFFVDGWSWKKEIAVLGFLLLTLVVEDFLWFVLNPAFGLKNFKKDNLNLWWHKRWVLGLPEFYWILFPLGLFLMFLGFK